MLYSPVAPGSFLCKGPRSQRTWARLYSKVGANGRGAFAAVKCIRKSFMTCTGTWRSMQGPSLRPHDPLPNSSSSNRHLSVVHATSSQATSSNERSSSSSATSTSDCQVVLGADAKLLRRVLSAASAAEVVDILVQQHDMVLQGITPEDAELILQSSLQQGNITLALSVYREMCIAKRAQTSGTSTATCSWPAAALGTTTAVVLGLCEQLRVNDALSVMEGIRSQGVPKAEEVSYWAIDGSAMYAFCL